MDERVSKFLLAGDYHFRQPGFKYSACAPFTKKQTNKQTKTEYKKLKKQKIYDYIYQNKLEKACFQHDMA